MRRQKKHEQMSGSSTFPEDLESLGYTPSLAKPKMGKKLEDKRPIFKKTGRIESK